jgi:hypothetical protein
LNKQAEMVDWVAMVVPESEQTTEVWDRLEVPVETEVFAHTAG